MRDASVAVCASQTEKRRPAPGLASGGVSLRCVDVLGWRCLWLAWGCSVSTKPSRSVPWLVTPLFCRGPPQLFQEPGLALGAPRKGQALPASDQLWAAGLPA